MTQLLQNAAAGTVVILVAALLRRGLKSRLAPEVWLALWAVCLLRLLSPVAPESALSVYSLPQQLAQEAAAVQTGPVSSLPGQSGTPEQTAAVLSASAAESAGPALTPGDVLAAVWLLGAAAMALRYAWAWWSARRSVNRAPLVNANDPRCAALPKGVRLREGLVDGAPLTFGVARPTVVLSPGLTGTELACVLAHEGVHAQRRDNLWHYATAAALTVFWWNPAVWLMVKLLRRDVELSCDRAALRRLGPEHRREYALALLSMSAPEVSPSFSQTFGQKQAEERILAVMNYKKMTVCGLALALALVVGVTAAFGSDPVKNVETGTENGVVSYQFTLTRNVFDPGPFNSTGLFQLDSGFFVFGMRDRYNEPSLFTFITDDNGAYRAQETNLEAIAAHMEELVADGDMTWSESQRMLERFQTLLDPTTRNCARVYFSGEAIYKDD